MFKYILKRIGYSILVLIGVSLIIYFLTRLMPIDFVEKKISNITTNARANGIAVPINVCTYSMVPSLRRTRTLQACA